jgi:hypothetical protein
LIWRCRLAGEEDRLPSRRKPIGTGGRGLPEIDEDALIKRYTLAGVSIAGCARQFRVSPERVKRILAAHGVEVRGPAVPPDQAAVVAAYQRHQSVSYVASALGIHDKKVREILSAHGVKTPRPPRPLLSMEYADPAPADRGTGSAAAGHVVGLHRSGGSGRADRRRTR